MAARISKADFDEKVLKSKLPVIVDFYSDSCVPARSWHRFSEISRMIMRIASRIQGQHKLDGELADEYEVTANPTLLFVKDAEVLDRKIGVQKPADLKAWVEALL